MISGVCSLRLILRKARRMRQLVGAVRGGYDGKVDYIDRPALARKSRESRLVTERAGETGSLSRHPPSLPAHPDQPNNERNEMSKVDRTQRPSEAWDKLAEQTNDHGPKVEELVQQGDEMETEPYNESVGIDATHVLDGS